MSDITQERLELTEETGSNPEGLLDKINDIINELVPTAGKAASNYISGKGLKPLVEVSAIKAQAYEKIAKIAQDNQRLVMEHKEKMYQLETERRRQKADEAKTRAEAEKIRAEALAGVASALQKLQECGCDIKSHVTLKKLLDTAE